MFEFLLQVDTIRGPDSTGVFKLDKFSNEPKGMLVKGVGTPWDLEKFHANYKRLFAGFSKLYIGHNRSATRGSVSGVNAHPFRVGKIVGAHNGTLRDQSLLPDSSLFDVDSENIFHTIDKIGVEDTIKKIDGSFALTWYNAEEQTMNFIRNIERDLHYAYSKDHKTLVWASEKWMLAAAFTKYNLQYDEPVLFESGVHYKVPIPVYVGNTMVELSKPIAKRLTLHVPTYQSHRMNNYYEHDYDYQGHQSWHQNRRVIQYTPTPPNAASTQVLLPSNKGTNVFPISNVSNKSNTMPITAEHLAHVGQVIHFSAVQKNICQNRSQSYLACMSAEGFNVKVHMDSRTQLFTDCGYHGTILKGRVRSVEKDKDTGLVWLVVKTKTLTLVMSHVEARKQNKSVKDFESEADKEDHPLDDIVDDDNKTILVVAGCDNRLVSVKEYSDLIQDGCSLCADSLVGLDPDEVHWVDMQQTEYPCCAQCFSDLQEAEKRNLIVIKH